MPLVWLCIRKKSIRASPLAEDIGVPVSHVFGESLRSTLKGNDVTPYIDIVDDILIDEI